MKIVTSFAMAALFWLAGAIAPGSSPAMADADRPTLAEVTAFQHVLRFRDAMISDPKAAIRSLTTRSGRRQLDAIAEEMDEAGSGSAGWRTLLGTSVFTVEGLASERRLVVFYNPFVDTALFTVWDGKRIAEAEWVPGDLVRAADAEIDPQPLWLRGAQYRPEALAQAVVATVSALERRFAGDAIAGWRRGLGIEDGRAYRRYVAPIVAVRLYEAQMRLKALAVPTTGEDPRLAQLRAAVAGLLRSVRTQGFAGPLAEAGDTSGPMRDALSRINPRLMDALAPVAFVAGEGHATVFLTSAATADFAISVRYAQTASGYALRQLEYLPFAAIHQAAANEVR
ncbi:hypothetical protein [Polymorphum gilvum]|uniref:hypothetical protein n=1 Tax=Polymorphum gilvum TaxID=991904 RepID=UPI0011D2BD10|nr:hypothetical protein [Polymorphum gilvum]